MRGIRVRRSVLAGLAAGAAFALIAGGASAADAAFIKPQQHFLGVVNGAGPTSSALATVDVVCAGNHTTGHVAAGQTLSVHATSSGPGFTGVLSHVYAWFDQDARSPEPAEVTFGRYDTSRAVPFDVRVPCSGLGTVTFSACPEGAPCVAGWVPTNVAVRFKTVAP